jgi:hypothetical protein
MKMQIKIVCTGFVLLSAIAATAADALDPATPVHVRMVVRFVPH